MIRATLSRIISEVRDCHPLTTAIVLIMHFAPIKCALMTAYKYCRLQNKYERD